MASMIHVVEKPAPLVSLDEARRHLVEIPAEDEEYVKALVLAATTWIDGPTGWLGRALGVQTLELETTDLYCGDDSSFPLPFCPVLDVVSIRWRDSSGAMQTIAAEQYEADLCGVVSLSGSWPFFTGQASRLYIRYKVGCGRKTDAGDLVTDVPEPIRHAILLLVGHWYRNRETVVIGATVENLPFAVDALLQPYRIYR